MGKRINLPTEREAFRLHPFPRRRCYYAVFIADTRPQMRAWIREMMAETDPHLKMVDAMCYGTSPFAKTQDNVRAVLFFARDYLGVGTVSHELAHAAFRVFATTGRLIDHAQEGASLLECAESGEEQFCQVMERTHAEFWREAYRRGYATPEMSAPVTNGRLQVPGP